MDGNLDASLVYILSYIVLIFACGYVEKPLDPTGSRGLVKSLTNLVKCLFDGR